MLSLRSDASIDLAEPGRGLGHGATLYAATLVIAALLVIVRFARFYAFKRARAGDPEPVLKGLLEKGDSEAGRSEAADAEATDAEAAADEAAEDESADVPEVARPARFAVYDFDETLSRATYPQGYDGTPFGCMALSIAWDDPRAGACKRADGSPTKEFGGFDDARVEQLQRHFAAMRAQGWTLCVLSYNLQWDKREFSLPALLDHYGLLRYFTSHGTPLVWGLRDMRRVGATSKGDFVSKLVQYPAFVAGLNLACAPTGEHLLVDDDEVNIAGCRTAGILGYQVAKRFEWDGLVGGLGRADPHDFAKLEQIAALPEAEVGERKRRKRRRERQHRSDARGKK